MLKIFSAILLNTATGFAQQPADSINNKLSEVIISSFHINDSLLNAPASISILSAAELQRNNNTDISTVFNKVPGVYMQSGGINTNRLTIRGIGARTPYGTNKIRAFYGSIPLTSGDSETTIEDIDLEILNNAEIIKGPLSSVYGAGLGGAVILTPQTKNTTGNTALLSSTAGSFGLIKNTIRYGYATEKNNLNISYHNLQTDGYRENSAYKRDGITLAGQLFKSKNSVVTYFGNFTSLKAYISSSVDKESFENNPQAAAPTWAAAKGYEEYDSYLGGLAYDWQVASGLKNATSVFINLKENYEPRPFDILTQNSAAFGARSQFTGSFALGKINPEFIIGVEFFKDGFKGNTFTNLYENNNGNGSLQGEQLTGTEQNRDFVNAFAQLRIPVIKKVEVQAGLNYNKTNFQLDNNFPEESISSQDYSYNAIWSPQLSVLYKPAALQTLYVSVSHGFSLPGIEETLTPEGTINPNIRPESGYNLEAGAKLYLFNKKLYTELSLYSMEIKDLLVAQRTGDDQYVGVNAGKTMHQGVEFSVNYFWQLNNSLSLRPYIAASIGSYKFKDFIDGDKNFTGNNLTGVPANKLNGGFTFETAFGVYLSSDFYFTDKIPLNDANSEYSDSYNILNLKAGYRFMLFKDLTAHIAAGANNITDTHYASMVLVNATGFGGTAPRYYYPGLPSNYYSNVAFTYSF